MKSARDDIFASIRSSLGVTDQDASRRAAVANRIARAAPGPVPALHGLGLTNVFLEHASRSQMTTACVEDLAQIPQCVSQWLSQIGAPQRLRMGADRRLADFDWTQSGLETSVGSGVETEPNTISYAFGAIAETGSIVLSGGPDNPNSLAFLSDNHIVLLDESAIVQNLEGIFERLRRKGDLARAVNLVTGPSRSADIEQTLLLGAHGPKNVQVIVIGSLAD